MTIEIQSPELEALIRERMITGGFHDVEEVLLQALKSSEGKVPPIQSPKKSLVQFLLESPLPGSDLDLERQRDAPRVIDL